MRIARFAMVGAALAGCSFSAPGGAGPDDAPDAPPDVDGGGRVVDDHLIAVWRFAEGSGLTVGDTVRMLRPTYTGTPMGLTIESAAGVQWIGTEGLQIDGPVQIRTATAPRPHMTAEVNASGAVTLELWVTPAVEMPGPPAGAMFALGAGPSNRSVRIQQRGNGFVGNAKTAATMRGTERPIPTPSGAVKAALQHVVLVADGATRTIYVDGEAYPAPAGDIAPMAGWNDTFRISIGDESGGGGAWRGQIWFAAVYDRALSADEVGTNRAAGHDCWAC